MAYRTGFWGLDGPLEGPIPIRRASSFNAGAPKADHLCVGAAENGKRDVGGLGWARPCLAFCHKCHIYDVMRSTKKLEGLLNLIRAGAREDGIHALAAAARSPRSEGSTRRGGSRSRTDVIGHSSGRRTPLVYGGVYIWHDAAAMQAYLASDLAKGVVGNPNFANLTSRDFEVVSGPTTSSGGPVAASLTARASLAS